MKAGGRHHFPVGLGHVIDDIKIAVTHNGGAEAQEVGVADVDGVGVQGVGNGNAALTGFVFHILCAQIVIQCSHGRFRPHFPPVDAGGQLVFQHLSVVHTVVKARKNPLGGGLVGVVAFEDFSGNDAAVFIPGFLPGHGKRGVPQGVQHQARLLVQGEMGDHICGTGLGVIAPILVDQLWKVKQQVGQKKR